MSHVKQQFVLFEKNVSEVASSIAQKSKIFLSRLYTCFQKKVLAKVGHRGNNRGEGKNKNFFNVKNRTPKTVEK